ncbi:MAG: SDR family oxidoreductase [Alphaproteobacteria bacterium]|jgi:NAD(P)-dependent dehydrogenase (short-subunit alcohol dehydrogenase family)|nr:SDR family oxidoreductase [Alphaproteobacteria bacterium]
MPSTADRPVALVTAAGKGMGAAIARRLAADGYAIATLSPSGGAEALATELGGFGVTGSLTEPADTDRLIDGALERWGRIDALVINAGHPPKGALLDLTDDDWRQAFDLMFLSAVRMLRRVVPAMRDQGGGSVTVLSSFAAIEPDAGFATSAVVRGGLHAFTKMLADQEAPNGIRLNTVVPGFIDSLPEKPGRRERIPMGRYGTTAEVADAVAFLASPAASYLTGQTLRLDGGMIRAA